MLHAGRYHLRKFNFRNALFVFDEYHLFTPKMMHVLRAFIETFGAHYRFSTLFMSASPSFYYKNLLMRSLSGNIRDFVLGEEYHRLRRHNIVVRNARLESAIEDDEVSTAIYGTLNRGGRVLILANTVDKAIDVYLKLKSAVRSMNKNIVLLHSRFSVIDRFKKEEHISAADVLVSTQVAEVSLDVSFDLLVTEVAPIPSIIQRLGRVNRYGVRAGSVNVYICTDTDEKPYFKSEMEASRRILRDHCEDIRESGEGVYLSVLREYGQMLSKILYGASESFYEEIKTFFEEGIKCFYAVERTEEEILSEIRENADVMAIPESYVKNATEILNKLRTERDYDLRKELLAKLKRYFISVPFYIANEEEFNEELGTVSYTHLTLPTKA